MEKGPCLKDVAREAGVHVSTVSRALHPDTARLLSAEVVARIRAIAARMGYCPNASAATLRTQRSGAVAMVVPDLSHPSFPDILRGAQWVLGQAGLICVVYSVEHDFATTEVILREIRARQFDGAIIATAQVDDPFLAALVPSGLPVVAVNAAHPDCPSVLPDDDTGIALALTHLRGLGHRRIAHLAGPAPTMSGRVRRQAFLAQGGEADLVETASAYTRQGAHQACRALLERAGPGQRGALTAIVAANDLLALGCLDVLRERGLSCPDDVSLSGVLDLPHMDLVAPALTTIHVDSLALGQDAALLLMRRLDGEPARPQTLRQPVTLVARQSTASPRRDGAA